MDIIYRRGRATAAELLAELPDPPSHSAVRSALWLLESRGYLAHEQDGPRNVYLPTLPAEKIRRSAVKHLLQTFFSGSRERAVAAILEASDAALSDEELARLDELLDRARARARKGSRA